ncbi:hypothetical protein ACFXJ8_39030 [Nonomuraea sp. NPDC059194]|uniref:hypothetical protein n=1 Tax=Nonomuraea sp. NPDC059194 TaxID=3346764 RepID=UPI0036AA6132
MSTSDPDHSHQIPQHDLRNRRRTVSRADFAAVSRGMPRLDDRKYRKEMDHHVNDGPYDPDDRACGRGEVADDE